MSSTKAYYSLFQLMHMSREHHAQSILNQQWQQREDKKLSHRNIVASRFFPRHGAKASNRCHLTRMHRLIKLPAGANTAENKITLPSNIRHPRIVAAPK